MIGFKISELPSVGDLKDTDFLVLSRGKTTRRISGEIFRIGAERVQILTTRINELSANTIFVRQGRTIDLFYNNRTRTLSAEISDEIKFKPSTPLLYTQTLTANFEMHGRVVIIDSSSNATVFLPNNDALIEYSGDVISAGITIKFLRKGSGEVEFLSLSTSEVNTFPDPSFNKIAHQNAMVTAYYMGESQWVLEGHLGSDTEGYLMLDSGIDYNEEVEVTPTPSNTPSPTTSGATPSPTPSTTPSTTPSSTSGITPSPTPSITPSSTSGTTPSPTPSNTPSPTPSSTTSGTTPSPTPSNTPSNTPSPTPSTTPSPTPSNTPSPTPSNTPSPTPSNTPSPTPSSTPTSPSYLTAVTEAGQPTEIDGQNVSIIGARDGDIIYVSPQSGNLPQWRVTIKNGTEIIGVIDFFSTRAGSQFGFRLAGQGSIGDGPQQSYQFPMSDEQEINLSL